MTEDEKKEAATMLEFAPIVADEDGLEAESVDEEANYCEECDTQFDTESELNDHDCSGDDVYDEWEDDDYEDEDEDEDEDEETDGRLAYCLIHSMHYYSV